ncbi:MAG: hypothetical protein ACRDC3_08600 [Paraclostridium dentum]|uniref:hypothetical protein n=1 Tax=Paraclostridium dentum TaxID=2662455 RepID=UPI003EE67667
MNNNKAILCEVCNSGINLRYQVGFIENFDIKFCCPECGSPITINIKLCDPPKIEFSLKNAVSTSEHFEKMKFSVQTSSEFVTPKDFTNPHNKLLSDSENQIPDFLMPPFIQSKFILGTKNLIEFQTHCKRGLLYKEKFNIYERINFLYFSESTYFISELNKQLNLVGLSNIKVENNKKSMLNGIYQFNIRYFDGFLCSGEFALKNEVILNSIKKLKKDNKKQFDELIDFFTSNKLIDIYERRILRTINNYIINFNEFIPSINLKYLNDNTKLEYILSNYTTRALLFDDIKNIYLEVYENLLEIYNVVMALNNVFYRNDFKKMPPRPKSLNFLRGNKVNLLSDFMSLNKGCKTRYLNNSEIFNTLMPNLNSNLRNIIGHESWEYDEITQKIKFENTEQDKFLLEYAFECYSMLVNCVAIYKLLIDIKYNSLN